MSAAGWGSPAQARPGLESSPPASQPGGCLAWLVGATQHVSGSTFAEWFPSFINERWQQSCELGLSGRALRGWAGLAPGFWGSASALCCSCRQVTPSTSAPRVKCVHSGAEGSFPHPPPGLGWAGLGRAGQDRAIPVHPPPYRRPHTGSWAYPVIQVQKPFEVGACVTKCLSSQNRCSWRRRARPLPRSLPLPLILTLGGGWGSPGCREQKTRHRGGSALLSTNSNRPSLWPRGQPGWPGRGGHQLGVASVKSMHFGAACLS